MGAEITFKRPDGGDAKGYSTNAAHGDAPGVVVIQEWWGLSEQIKAIVRPLRARRLRRARARSLQGRRRALSRHGTRRKGDDVASTSSTRPSRTCAARSSISGATAPRSASPASAWAGRWRSSARRKSPSLSRLSPSTGFLPSEAVKPADVEDSAAGPFRQSRTTSSRPRRSTISRRRSTRRKRMSSSSATTPITPSSTSSGCPCTTATRRNWPGAAPTAFLHKRLG